MSRDHGRGQVWRLRLLALFGVLLGLLVIAHGAWAAPSQQPVRQTVPTRTPIKSPTGTPTNTRPPSVSATPTPTQSVTQPTDKPTEGTSPEPTTTQATPEPTAQPTTSTAAQGSTAVPVASPGSQTPAVPDESVQFPQAGVDWGVELWGSARWLLGGLLTALGLGALTFVRRSPTDGHV